ncbi:MAG: hypothetical protein SPJ23_06365 [Eubacteriales bacterium]|nr:hypothetical protein [Eubacteriales bacterium]
MIIASEKQNVNYNRLSEAHLEKGGARESGDFSEIGKENLLVNLHKKHEAFLC